MRSNRRQTQSSPQGVNWITAFEQAQEALRRSGLQELLALPPERLLEGLRRYQQNLLR